MNTHKRTAPCMLMPKVKLERPCGYGSKPGNLDWTTQQAIRNKCLASSNRCLTSSNKKLLGATRSYLIGLPNMVNGFGGPFKGHPGHTALSVVQSSVLSDSFSI